MTKYYISINKDNIINYGKTLFDGVVTEGFKTWESFDDETKWKKQLVHYQGMYPQDILDKDPDFPVIPDEDLFPYPDRNIMAYVPYKQLITIMENPDKYVVEKLLSSPHEKLEGGAMFWFDKLEDEKTSKTEVKAEMEKLNIDIVEKAIKENDKDDIKII